MINIIIQSILNGYSGFFIFLSSLLGSLGLATIMLSFLAALLMTIPMSWAEKIAVKDTKIQAIISPQIHKIKKDKTGFDQHSSIQRLYSRYSYNPLFIFRSLMPLFIQLPFLIFTYFMFSRLQGIQGESFLWIKDLSSPDGILYGKGNVLPFLMTFVSLIAAFFMPNFTYKNLLQAVSVSLLFFILLYSERSILLLFWTFNNIIMLVRNIISALKNGNINRYSLFYYWKRLNSVVTSNDAISFVIYVFVCSVIFKTNFHAGFMGRFSLSLIVIASGLLMILILLIIIKKIKKQIDRQFDYPLPISHIFKSDFLITLLPISFIIKYAIVNQDIMSVNEQLEFILKFSIGLIGFIWLVPLIISKILPTTGYLAFSLSLSIIFVTFPLLVVQMGWALRPDLALLLFILGCSTVVVYLLLTYKRKLLLSASVLFFMFNIIVTNHGSERELVPELLPSISYSNFIPKSDFKTKPDVYLLTYDSYVGQETMNGYGIDNSVQENFLKENGFKIYPNAYSEAADSRSTMARVLEMSENLELPTQYSTAGHSLVVSIFENKGYDTYGILTPYLLATPFIGYQNTFPPKDSLFKVVGDAMRISMFEGQFRFNVIDETTKYSHEEWVEQKRKVLKLDSPSPKFMYTHTGPGHSQNSGKCLPNENELFEQRLIKSNIEMKQDIKAILDSDRNAIIIINGDHGPYLTGDCVTLKNTKKSKITRLDLQDRFGTFLAIKWPTVSYIGFDKINVLQDTFESVFKYLYQSNNILEISPSTSTVETGFSEPGAIVNGVITIGVDKGKPLFINK